MQTINTNPQTDAEALTVADAFRAHVRCEDCLSRRGYCDRYNALFTSMKDAASRGLSPYVVRYPDGVLRGVWDKKTAEFFVRRDGGTIVKAPSIAKGTGVEHTENIKTVEGAWLSKEGGEMVLNIRGTTAGGTRKVYRIPGDQAGWLRACIVDAFRPIMQGELGE
jgi:hypothetical protein